MPVVKAPGRRGEKRARPRRDASPLEREGRRRRHVARPAGLAPPPQHSRIAHTSTPPRVAPSQTGFDPLYLSEFIDIKWAREAELKQATEEAEQQKAALASQASTSTKEQEKAVAEARAARFGTEAQGPRFVRQLDSSSF